MIIQCTKGSDPIVLLKGYFYLSSKYWALLADEADNLYKSLFKKSENYVRIVEALADMSHCSKGI